MRRHVLIGTLCLFGLAASVSAAPLAERLPADTKAYIGWAGRTLPFDGSMLGQLINEPAVGEIFRAIHEAAVKNLPQGKDARMFEHAWAMSATAWQHPAALALFDVRKGDKDPPVVSAAMLIDLGKDRAAFDKELKGILQAAGDENKFADVTVGTVTYKSMPDPDGNDLSIGYIGDVFFFTVGAGTPARLIGVTPPKALKASRKFAENFRAVAGENIQLAVYVDIEALLKQVEEVMPPADEPPPPVPAGGVSGMRRILNATGMGKAGVLVGTVRVVDRGLYTRVRLLTPAPHTGLLMPLAGAVLLEADLAGVPADADVMFAAGISADAAWAELLRMLETAAPEAHMSLSRGLAATEKKAGVSLSKDLLAHLGDKWVLSSAPSQGGFLTGTVLSVRVKDAVKLRAAVAKLEALAAPKPPAAAPAAWTCAMHPAVRMNAAGKCPMCGMALVRAQAKPDAAPGDGGPRILTVKAARTEIHYLALPGLPVPVAPAWAIHKDKLYLAAWPQVIQTVLEASGRKGLTGDPTFRKMRARVAAKPSILYYVNTTSILRKVYGVGLLGWTAGANMLASQVGVPMRPDWLPALSRLEKYLWPQIRAISADAKGITFEGYGSLPSLDMFTLPLQASILAPALSHGLVRARQSVRTANIHLIGMGLHMYAGENNGRFPESIMEEKFADYVGGRDSPLWRDIKAGKYTYVRGLSGGDEGQLVVVYEKPAGRGSVPVAFLDGRVERMDPEAFARALERTMDYLRKRSKKPGGN